MLEKLRNLVVCALALLLLACSASNPTHLINMRAPVAVFSLLDGERIALHSFEGKPVVVLFWAEHCSKSRQSLSAIKDLAAHNLQAVFIAASIDELKNEEKVRERVRTIEPTRVITAFSGNDVYDEAYRAFSGKSVPLIILVDSRGNVVLVSESTNELKEALGELKREGEQVSLK